MTDPIPARVVPQDGMMVHIPQFDSGNNFVVSTSFPTDTQERRSKVLDIIEGESLKVDDVLGQTLFVTDYICHPVQIQDTESGEIVDAVRTILVDADGRCVATFSAGVLKSLGRLSWAEGRMPPWVPPVACKLVQRASGKKRVYKLVHIPGGA